jgi:class 3 adenylate cyclase
LVRLLRKRLDKPDEVRTFTHGRVEIFEIGDNIVGRTVYEPGWRWSEDVKPIAGTDLCMYHHLGYCLGGLLHVVLEDGTSLEIGAEEAFEIPPAHDAWVIGDEPWITVDFAGMRSFARPVVGTGERILSTILFTDIVDSTAMAVRVGDAAWRELLSRHNERGRFELDRFRGREIDTTGDGFLALFDSSERAVRAAAGICTGASGLGIEIRAGIHTGEVELVPGNVRGVAVHMAARVMALAAPSEVLVSGTTYELLAGSSLAFEDRGLHELKGISGARRIYALARPADR